MSGLKEIRRRITSVKNTRQITRAMKLVSAAKLRRAQQLAESGRSYREKLQQLLATVLADLGGEIEHPLLQRADTITSRTIIVVSADRGLCGAYNANLVKGVQQELREAAIPQKLVLFGRKSLAAAHRFGWNVAKSFEGMAENAGQWPIDEVARLITEEFKAGPGNEVVVYYTKFISAMTQRVEREVVLPFDFSRAHSTDSLATDSGAHEGEAAGSFGSFKYGADPRLIVERLIPLLVKVQLVQAAFESKASEHAARMTAMDSATSNADDLIGRLRLFYNRARQSAITRELIDIVGGAEAQK